MQNESIYWGGMGKKSDCNFYNIWKCFIAFFSGKLYTKCLSCFFVSWFMWTKFEMKHWNNLKGKKDFFSWEIWKEWERKRYSEIYANKVIGIKWFYTRSADHRILAIPGLFHTVDQSVEVDAQRETWQLKEKNLSNSKL